MEGKDMMDPQKRWNINSYFYDIWTAPMEMMGGRSWRTMLFSELPEGRILEIGIGTGANIEHYPRTNRAYVGIDISPNMLKRTKDRADKLNISIELKIMDAQHMDFPDNTFDAVVSSCVFCSVPDPLQGLKEAQRVLKKHGIALFLEHMRPEGKTLGKVFDTINPLTRKLVGVNINRRTVQTIKNAGFEIIEERMLFKDIFRFIKAKPL
jgi:ubiquinone/menaquinone biosynthesis C-methylase UbiE